VIILLNFKKSNNLSQNLLISLKATEGNQSKIGDEISDIVTKYSNQVNLKRLKYSQGLINFNFLVNVDSFAEIKKINEKLTSFDKSIDITFIDSEI
jgi:hypothetical protein